MPPPTTSLLAPDALSGHVVLLTGATGPVGRATARALASARAHLLLHYHAHPEIAQALRDELASSVLALLPADLTRPSAPEALLSAASAYSFPSAIVNATALFLPDSAPDADLARMRALNLDAPLALLRAFAEHSTPPRPSRACVIHLLDSRIASPTPLPSFAAYHATKRTLTDSIPADARRLAPLGIRVLGIAPGPLTLPPGIHAPAGPRPLANTPLTPADVANTITFALAAPALTGQILYVDAGQHLALSSSLPTTSENSFPYNGNMFSTPEHPQIQQ